MTASTSKTELRRIDDLSEVEGCYQNRDFMVEAYEATRDGRVLGTIKKFDEPAWRTDSQGKQTDYREIYWIHSLDDGFACNAYETIEDCTENLERAAGVTS